MLARVSQELDRELGDVARELSDTGTVPGSGRRRTDRYSRTTHTSAGPWAVSCTRTGSKRW